MSHLSCIWTQAFWLQSLYTLRHYSILPLRIIFHSTYTFAISARHLNFNLSKKQTFSFIPTTYFSHNFAHLCEWYLSVAQAENLRVILEFSFSHTKFPICQHMNIWSVLNSRYFLESYHCSLITPLSSFKSLPSFFTYTIAVASSKAFLLHITRPPTHRQTPRV